MLHARAAPREIRVAGNVVAEGGRLFDLKPAAHWLMGGKAWGWAAACDRKCGGGRTGRKFKKVQETLDVQWCFLNLFCITIKTVPGVPIFSRGTENLGYKLEVLGVPLPGSWGNPKSVPRVKRREELKKVTKCYLSSVRIEYNRPIFIRISRKLHIIAVNIRSEYLSFMSGKL